jgi:hypothetical protein
MMMDVDQAAKAMRDEEMLDFIEGLQSTDLSFQMILRLLREQGVSNPTALDAGALIDAEVFNHRHGPGSYFGDFYEDRIKTMHPSSRFGVFAAPPVYADDYFFLRDGLVEVYHWLITKQRVQASLAAQ